MSFYWLTVKQSLDFLSESKGFMSQMSDTNGDHVAHAKHEDAKLNQKVGCYLEKVL